MSRLDSFVADRQPDWNQLALLVSHVESDRRGLTPDSLHTLGRLYRAASADLAWCRQLQPDGGVTESLDDLVGRARHIVYAHVGRRAGMRRFFSRTYWQRIRERPRLLAVCAVLLFGPGVVSAVWASEHPDRAAHLLPEEYRSVGDNPGGDLGLSTAEQSAFASQIFTNNIQVSFLAFAGGIALCLGTAFVLFQNGLLLGGVAGLSIAAGNEGPFVELVSAHGVLELSVIVVCAAAGMRMGWAVIDPGVQARGAAIVEQGRAGVEIVLGTMPWFVLAGLVEGFVTPRGLGPGGALLVGVPIGLVYWALVVWRGRPDALVMPVTAALGPWPGGTKQRRPLKAGAPGPRSPRRRVLRAG